LKRIAGTLATKWQKPYSVPAIWVKVRMQFAWFGLLILELEEQKRKSIGPALMMVLV